MSDAKKGIQWSKSVLSELSEMIRPSIAFSYGGLFDYPNEEKDVRINLDRIL
jgi:hypothetical protein